VDLRASFPPIANQDGIGWCYAYGGAAQMSYWAIQNHVPGISLQDKHYVSSAAGALQYDRKKRSAEYKKLAVILSIKRAALPRVAELVQASEALDVKMYARMKIVGKNNLKTDSEYRSLNDELNRINNELSNLEKSYEGPSFKEPESGISKELLDSLSSGGLCLESQVSSTDNAPAAELQDTWLSTTFNNAYENYLDDRSSENICSASIALHQVFPNLKIPEIQATLTKFSISSHGDPIESLRRKSCDGHLIKLHKKPSAIPIPRPTNLDQSSTNEVLSNQFKSLLDKKIPVGIGYRPEVYYFGPESLRETLIDGNTSHYSVLVGKKFDCNTKKVVYILRNSLGDDACEADRPNFQRYPFETASVEYSGQARKIWDEYNACKKSCPNTDDPTEAETAKELGCMEHCERVKADALVNLNQPPYTCDNGDYVIDEDQLMPGVINGTYLK
jgi:hypothetical protein